MWPASRFRLRYFGRNIRFRGGVCTLGAVSIRTDERGDPGLNFPCIGKQHRQQVGESIACTLDR